MRINKLLSNLGICSRKDTARFIEEGRIKVNNIQCVQGQWIKPQDSILLDDKPLLKKDKIYIILNKPIGITCTAAKEVKDNIISFVNYNEYIFPVGRLDKLSQGLIILTNDGPLANKILESENYHEKEYLVTVNKNYDESFINNMSSGVDLGRVKTREAVCKPLTNDTFSIILTQGLNRQIRRMCKALGYEVVKLERVRIMNIKIEGLEYGQWRFLTEKEISTLKNMY